MFEELYSFFPELRAALIRLAPRFSAEIIDLDIGAYDQIAASINLKVKHEGRTGHATIKLASAVGLSTESVATYLLGAAIRDAKGN